MILTTRTATVYAIYRTWRQFSSIARISYEGNFGWETHSPSITKVTRSVLYPEQKDSYGMFISEYINPEYLFPNT